MSHDSDKIWSFSAAESSLSVAAVEFPGAKQREALLKEHLYCQPKRNQKIRIVNSRLTTLTPCRQWTLSGF